MQGRTQSYRDLIVWQKAMDLARSVYEISKGFPKQELFGLTSQIRRAAVSIPSNVAEGSARRTTRDFIAFLHIARGSLAELDTQLELCERSGFLRERGALARQINELDDLSTR